MSTSSQPPFAPLPRPVMPPEPQTVAGLPPAYPPVYHPYSGWTDISGIVRGLAICYVLLGGLAGLVLLAGGWFLVFSSGGINDPHIPPSTPIGFIVGLLVAGLLLAAALPLTTGCSLLARKPWARTLAIVNACVILVSFPFGTALGGCTLYFLLRSGAQESWDAYASGRM